MILHYQPTRESQSEVIKSLNPHYNFSHGSVWVTVVRKIRQKVENETRWGIVIPLQFWIRESIE